jgi:hypothetical protein
MGQELEYETKKKLNSAILQQHVSPYSTQTQVQSHGDLDGSEAGKVQLQSQWQGPLPEAMQVGAPELLLGNAPDPVALTEEDETGLAAALLAALTTALLAEDAATAAVEVDALSAELEVLAEGAAGAAEADADEAP